MFAIDTNLLVYAHNTASEFHEHAARFVEHFMNRRDEAGKLSVCLPTQVLMEFVHVITWQRLETPLYSCRSNSGCSAVPRNRDHGHFSNKYSNPDIFRVIECYEHPKKGL